MQFVRDLRLIPIVVIAAAALFVLKTSAIVIEGGYTLTGISGKTAISAALVVWEGRQWLRAPSFALLGDCVLPGTPYLEVVGLLGGEAKVARAERDDAVMQPETLQRSASRGNRLGRACGREQCVRHSD